MPLNTLDKDEIIQFSRLANDWWDEEGSMSFLHAMSEIRTKFIKTELIDHFNLKENNKYYCCDHYAIHVLGKTMAQIEKELNDPITK